MNGTVVRGNLMSAWIWGCLALSTAVAAEPTTDWPQWRGPQRDGMVPGAQWPRSVDEATLAAQWNVDLGPSYSGPIVAGDKVFVTETRDRKMEVVHALDRATGRVLWTSEWTGAMSVPFFARANGDWIRSTPAYDDGRLYVAGMRDVLVCLDASTGKQLWTMDFVKRLETPLPSFGFVCSPLVHGDHVYVQAGAALTKLDKRTGKIVWQSLKEGGGMYGSAFSSPIIAKLAGREQLVVQTRKTLAGVGLKSGGVLWSEEIPAFRGMNILTPTVFKDSIFTSSYGGKSFLYQIAGSETAQLARLGWTNKIQGYMSSPVIIDGHAFIHLKNQRFACIDLATGKETWITRPYGKYWSMVSNGRSILALDQRGDLLLINANPKAFELVESRHISDKSTWAHLAVSGDQVFVRDLNRVMAFKWAGAQTVAPTSESSE